jgi:hypothetical protein
MTMLQKTLKKPHLEMYWLFNTYTQTFTKKKLIPKKYQYIEQMFFPNFQIIYKYTSCSPSFMSK